MSWRFYLYSKDRPRGVEFEGGTEEGAYHKSLQLAKEGWADNPEKLGINLGGADVQGKVDRIAREVREGLIPAIDPPQHLDSTAQAEVQKQVEKEAKAAAERKKREQEDIREPASNERNTKKKRKEEEMDVKSDLKYDNEIGKGKGQVYTQDPTTNKSVLKDEGALKGL